MKTIKVIIITVLGLIFIFNYGCYKEEVTEPRACLSVDKIEANVGEPVIFTNCGDGMAFSLWTGDTYHAISKFGEDAGFNLKDETYAYAYPEPGTFTAAIVATSYGNWGDDVLSDVDSLQILVTDGRAELTEFGFRSPKVIGTIEEFDMYAEVPYGTDLSGLKATFKTNSKFAVVTVGGVEQSSGKTANDFTVQVDFMVTAQNGATNTYTAHVFSIPDTGKVLTEFSIKGTPGTINGNTITVILPPGNSDLTFLYATFETSSDAALVKVNDVVQKSAFIANDFTNPVEYVVEAEDGSTNTYTIMVKEQMGFLTFGFQDLVPPVNGIFSGNNILLEVLKGTKLDSLVATYTVTDHNPVVKVNDIIQESGVTINNFSLPFYYTLETAEETLQYKVTTLIVNK
jgi:hypothetical protein